MDTRLVAAVLILGFAAGCSDRPSNVADDDRRGTMTDSTCKGIYPSYWQDPEFPEMYEGQTVSNQPPPGYSGRVFRLSDDFPRVRPDEAAEQPWRAPRFDALFEAGTDETTKRQLADDYIWAVLTYIQEGNINSGDIDTDWDVCNNEVRSWYNIPFQTYNVLAGREFTHGLTREAPVCPSALTLPTKH